MTPAQPEESTPTVFIPVSFVRVAFNSRHAVLCRANSRMKPSPTHHSADHHLGKKHDALRFRVFRADDSAVSLQFRDQILSGLPGDGGQFLLEQSHSANVDIEHLGRFWEEIAGFKQRAPNIDKSSLRKVTVDDIGRRQEVPWTVFMSGQRQFLQGSEPLPEE